MVYDGEHSRRLLVAELILLAEIVIHVIEVQLEHFDLWWWLSGSHVEDGLKLEDLGKGSSFFGVCFCFPQILRFVLIQLSVEEKLWFSDNSFIWLQRLTGEYLCLSTRHGWASNSVLLFGSLLHCNVFMGHVLATLIDFNLLLRHLNTNTNRLFKFFGHFRGPSCFWKRPASSLETSKS